MVIRILAHAYIPLFVNREIIITVNKINCCCLVVNLNSQHKKVIDNSNLNKGK